MTYSRRKALQEFGILLAGSPLLRADRTPPLDELVNLFEVESVARSKLAPAVYEHIAAGVGAGTTVRRNREAFDRITFRPRMLVDVREMDISLELFGQRWDAPILVGPTADHRIVHPDGEAATAKGAAAAKTLMVVSSRPSVPIQQIASVTKGPLWFQLDTEGDSNAMKQRVRGALDAGCKAICLTAGAPYEARPSWPPSAKTITKLTWTAIQQIREWSGVPVLIKGVLSPEEAQMCVEKGTQGIIVSNHGGRYVDGAPATIDVLPRIVDAVAGRVPVLIDGGFRRGTDILKALALGAKGVLLGRPPLWGLAAFGAEGVQKVLEMLQTELALAMGLSGKPDLAAVDRSLVKIHRR